MCDVLVAMPDATKRGSVIFGKNSDRPAGECQVLHYAPGRNREPDWRIECCYVSVPEIGESMATLGCRPYWSWGYETGMNEAGVIGGNTAIFTRSFHNPKHRTTLGLTGMELLRLGLERGRSAEKALEVIVDLLGQYGQWGSAVRGKDHGKGSYENAFLLADRREAWVLETSGRSWVAERIREGVRSVSNQPTIRTRWTRDSSDIEQVARHSGWWDASLGALDFARAFGDHEHYSRQVSHIRWRRTTQSLERNRGKIDVLRMMGILRDHYEDTFLEGPQFHAYLPDFHTVCMHDSPTGFTWGNTATSAVVELDPEGRRRPVFWVAYLPPCTSVYTAYPFGRDLPEVVTTVGKAGLRVRRPTEAPADEFDAASLWWRLHRIVEEVAKDPSRRYDEIRSLLDPLERRHVEQLALVEGRGREVPQSEWDRILVEHIGELVQSLEHLEERWKIDRTL